MKILNRCPLASSIFMIDLIIESVSLFRAYDMQSVKYIERIRIYMYIDGTCISKSVIYHQFCDAIAHCIFQVQVVLPWEIGARTWPCSGQYQEGHLHWYYEGILPKGPYLSCVSMAGRALFAGYHRNLMVATARADILSLLPDDTKPLP